MFYIAQFIGLIGLIIVIISFQKNNKKTLLSYQIISTIFFSIQYILLNALSGFFMNITMCIRNIILLKCNNNNKKIKIYIFFIICIMLFLSLLSYNSPLSMLPCIGSIIYTITLTKSNIKSARIVNSITCALYIIYNTHVVAIAGIISSSIELITTLYAIYKFDIKNYNK